MGNNEHNGHAGHDAQNPSYSAFPRAAILSSSGRCDMNKVLSEANKEGILSKKIERLKGLAIETLKIIEGFIWGEDFKCEKVYLQF